MTDTPKKLIVDLEKGTQEYVDLTAEEIQQLELDAIQHATERAEHEAAQAAKDALKASAKAKLIAGQALTEEEAATIVI
jgi:hypothetical protein